jgi:hypothetical protein
MLKTLAAAFVALALAGCAFAPPEPGAPREAVIARYGQPTRSVPLASGTRLQYSLQPLGRQVLMVDLDAAGRFVSSRQVMNPENFQRVMPDQWTRADVEREFGPPAKVDGVMSWTGDILTYRWLDVGQPMFFWVYLDPQNVVRKTGQGMEFVVRVRER